MISLYLVPSDLDFDFAHIFMSKKHLSIQVWYIYDILIDHKDSAGAHSSETQGNWAAEATGTQKETGLGLKFGLVPALDTTLTVEGVVREGCSSQSIDLSFYHC